MAIEVTSDHLINGYSLEIGLPAGSEYWGLLAKSEKYLPRDRHVEAQNAIEFEVGSFSLEKMAVILFGVV